MVFVSSNGSLRLPEDFIPSFPSLQSLPHESKLRINNSSLKRIITVGVYIKQPTPL